MANNCCHINKTVQPLVDVKPFSSSGVTAKQVRNMDALQLENPYRANTKLRVRTGVRHWAGLWGHGRVVSSAKKKGYAKGREGKVTFQEPGA
jgi:hypothetical protein